MANPDLAPHALIKPPRGSTATAKRRGKRLEAINNAMVYMLIDLRDRFRCRACSTYAGIDVHRHHLRGRTCTTLADVCHLCPTCHGWLHVRVGGVRLKLSGNADQRNRFGALNGLAAEWKQADGSWRMEAEL